MLPIKIIVAGPRAGEIGREETPIPLLKMNHEFMYTAVISTGSPDVIWSEVRNLDQKHRVLSRRLSFR